MEKPFIKQRVLTAFSESPTRILTLLMLVQKKNNIKKLLRLLEESVEFLVNESVREFAKKCQFSVCSLIFTLKGTLFNVQ